MTFKHSFHLPYFLPYIVFPLGCCTYTSYEFQDAALFRHWTLRMGLHLFITFVCSHLTSTLVEFAPVGTSKTSQGTLHPCLARLFCALRALKAHDAPHPYWGLSSSGALINFHGHHCFAVGLSRPFWELLQISIPKNHFDVKLPPLKNVHIVCLYSMLMFWSQKQKYFLKKTLKIEKKKKQTPVLAHHQTQQQTLRTSCLLSFAWLLQPLG